jgi:uncharacterized OB-fold protein
MVQQDQVVRISPKAIVFEGRGEIFSYTRVLESPESFRAQAPYYLALIKLDEGPLVTAQLTDVEGEPQIGDRVEMVTRKLMTEGERGIIVYGYKFRQILTRSS